MVELRSAGNGYSRFPSGDQCDTIPPTMITSGYRPALAQFRRFGSLAYRLAHAILGDEAAAAQAVEDTFVDLGVNDGLWPQWHDILRTVHARCRTAASAAPPPKPRPLGPSTDAATIADTDSALLPVTTVHAALSSLSDTDRETIWSALLDGAAAPGSWEPLASALHHFEVAITNENIPDPGESDWHE